MTLFFYTWKTYVERKVTLFMHFLVSAHNVYPKFILLLKILF